MNPIVRQAPTGQPAAAASMPGTKPAPTSSDKWLPVALGVLILAWTVVLSRAAWLKLESLGMGFDLGMYEQVIWNTAHGRPFATTAFNYTNIHLGSDVIPLEALLAPLYALAPGTMTLLILQVVAVGLGALPLYLLARDRLGSGWAGLGMAAAYLAYVPLLYLTLNEFQPRAFALACVLAAIWFLDRTRFVPYMAFLFLSLFTRSDVALFVIMIGVLAFLWRKPWRFSLAPAALGALWFVLALFVIVPHFKTTSGGFVYLGTYAWLGATPGEMVVTVLTRPLLVLETVFAPAKLTFLAQVLGPTLPFSLLRPDVLLLAAPTLAINLLSQFTVQSNITRQYGAMLYPVVYAGAVLGIAWLVQRRRLTALIPRGILVHAAVCLVLLLTLAESLLVGNPVVSLYRRAPSPRAETARAMLATVPAGAPLALSNHVGPFAAQRTGFYFFPPHPFYTSNTYDVAQYILVDARADGATPEVKQGLDELRSSTGWQLVAERDGYVLFQKRAL